MFRFTTVLGVALGVCMGTSAGAAIDKVKHVGIAPTPWAQVPVIQVVNDGNEFTHIEGGATFSAQVSAECTGAYKIRNTSLRYGGHVIGGGFLEASSYGYSDSVGSHGEHSLDKAASIDVPADKLHFAGLGIPADPVAACNMALGKEPMSSRWKKLQEGFELQSTRKLSFAVRCQSAHGNDLLYWQGASTEVQAVIQCAGNPQVQGPQIAAPFQVKSATVEVPSTIEGHCPAGVKTDAKVRIEVLGGAGDVAFRLDDSGNKGDVTNLHFTESQQVFETTVPFQVKAKQGAPQGTLTANPGSAGGGPANSFAAPVQRYVAVETLSPHAKSWPKDFFTVKCGPAKINPAVGELPGDLAVPRRPEPKGPAAALDARAVPAQRDATAQERMRALRARRLQAR